MIPKALLNLAQDAHKFIEQLGNILAIHPELKEILINDIAFEQKTRLRISPIKSTIVPKSTGGSTLLYLPKESRKSFLITGFGLPNSARNHIQAELDKRSLQEGFQIHGITSSPLEGERIMIAVLVSVNRDHI